MSVIWVNVAKRHLEGQMSRDDEKLAVAIVVILALILACWLARGIV